MMVLVYYFFFPTFFSDLTVYFSYLKPVWEWFLNVHLSVIWVLICLTISLGNGCRTLKNYELFVEMKYRDKHVGRKQVGFLIACFCCFEKFTSQLGF